MIKIPRFMLRTLIYVPVGLLVFIALGIGTPIGSRFLVFTLQALIPSISMDYNSGTINKNLEVKNVTIFADDVTIKSSTVQIGWNPICFIHNQLCVNQLKADHLSVTVKQETNIAVQTVNKSLDKRSHKFLLPFTLSVKNALVKDVKVQVGKQEYKSNKLLFSGTWDQEGLNLNKLESTGFKMAGVWEQSSNQNVKPSNAKKLNTHSSKIKLPLVDLPFPIFVDNATLVDNQLTLDGYPFIFNSISIQNSSWISTHLKLDKFNFEHAGIKSYLTGEIDFNDDYPTNISTSLQVIDANNLHESPLKGLDKLAQLENQRLELRLTNDFSKLKFIGKGTGPVSFDFNGSLSLIDASLPFDINIEALSGEWTVPDGQLLAKNMTVNADGNIKDININVKGLFSSPYIPKLNLNGKAIVSKNGLRNIHLDAISESGNLSIKGGLGWENGINWDLDAILDNLAINQFGESYTDELPTLIISGAASSTSHFNSDNWSLKIKNANLQGKFSKQPLQIRGSIEADSNLNISGDEFVAEALGAKLTLNKNKRTNKQSGTFSSQNLANIVPHLYGRLHSIFTISKDKNQDTIIWHKTDAYNIGYRDTHTKKISLSGTYRPLQQHFDNTYLKAEMINAYGLLIKSIHLKMNGDFSNQKWVLEARSKAAVKAIINTSLINKRLKLSVPSINIKNKKALWTTNNEIEVNYDFPSQQGSINAFCFHNDQQRFCSNSKSQIGRNGKLTVNYGGNVEQLVHAFLPKHLNIVGKLNAQSTISWHDFSKPVGNFLVNMTPGTLTLYPHRKIPRVFAYQSIKIDAKLDENQLNIKNQLKAENYAQIDSNVTISVQTDHLLSGNMDISKLQLTPIAEFFPLFNTLSGRVDSKLTLSGSISDPKLNGNIKLSNGEVAFIKNPTRFHNIDMSVDLNNESGNIAANWNMDKGKATMNGSFSWPKGVLNGDVNIAGKNLTAIEPPLAILTVDPKINIKIDQNNVHVSGDINVTNGDITIAPLPKQGTPLSSDVVFVDNQQKSTPERKINFVSNLNVNVSNKLKINGMGLSGNLGGKLSLRQDAGSQPLLFGNIKVVNGNYRFLGQTLSIQKGGLEFVGPIKNPSLDIEAVKDITEDDVTVGVKVTGTANRPKITLFSNPTLEQAEIVSYLFQGRGFSSSSSSDEQNNNNALLLSAALTLGSQAGNNNPLAAIGDSAENLASKLGVSNIQLNANDDGKVAISGYIGDRLLLKYGYGVFDPGYELTVRYYLLSKLYLETVSSALGQSLDIYYRFDISK